MNTMVHEPHIGFFEAYDNMKRTYIPLLVSKPPPSHGPLHRRFG